MSAEPREKTPSPWVRMTFVIPAELVDAWEAAKSRAQREGVFLSLRMAESIHNGQVLEVLIAEYLAGPEEER